MLRWAETISAESDWQRSWSVLRSLLRISQITQPTPAQPFGRARSSEDRRAADQSRNPRRPNSPSRRSISARVPDGRLRYWSAETAALVFRERHDRAEPQVSIGRCLSEGSIAGRIAFAGAHAGTR